LKREEEKRKKEEEKEQERLKREDEKRKKEEERKQKEEEKEQLRLKREEEKQKKELERKQKQEEKDRERFKVEETARQQADFLKSFLNKTPTTGRKSAGSANSSILERNNSSILDSSTVSNPDSSFQAHNLYPHQPGAETGDDIEVIEISENENPNESKPTNRSPASEFKFKPMAFQVKNGMALAPLLRRESLNTFEKDSVDKMVQVVPLPVTNQTSAPPENQKTEIDETRKTKINENENESEAMAMDKEEIRPEETDPVNSSEVTSMESETPTPTPTLFHPYLQSIKKGQGRTSTRTEVLHSREDADDIEVINPKEILLSAPAEINGQRKLRYKLLQFRENHRPAYWGTWRKKNLKVGPRRPFAQEEVCDM
jgi:hypothetical protein